MRPYCLAVPPEQLIIIWINFVFSIGFDNINEIFMEIIRYSVQYVHIGIFYLFEWYESSDGVNWERRPEVSGNLRPFFPGEAEISSLYTQAGEYWRVQVTPIEADTVQKGNNRILEETVPVMGEPGVFEVLILPELSYDQVFDPNDLLLLKSAWETDPDDLEPAIRVLFYENGDAPIDHSRFLRILGIIQDGWY